MVGYIGLTYQSQTSSKHEKFQEHNYKVAKPKVRGGDRVLAKGEDLLKVKKCQDFFRRELFPPERPARLGPRQSEDLSMPMSTAQSDEQTLQNSGSQTGSQAHSTMCLGVFGAPADKRSDTLWHAVTRCDTLLQLRYGTSALANATTATTNSNSSGSDPWQRRSLTKH